MNKMNIEEYSKNYLEIIEKVQKNNHILRISTITAICEISINKVDLNKFNEYITNTKNVTTKHSKNHDEYTVTKRGKVRKTFFNQLTINYKDISKKSIKIFLNGKLQLTGLSSLFECKLVIEMICKWLSECFLERITYNNFKIGMINSNFMINHTINLEKLQYYLINNHSNANIRFEPDTYPAINVKSLFDNKVSIFIFGSGNIVITGAKTLSEIKTAYEYISQILNNSAIFLRKKDQKTKKQETIYVNGYPIKELLSTLY